MGVCLFIPYTTQNENLYLFILKFPTYKPINQLDGSNKQDKQWTIMKQGFINLTKLTVAWVNKQISIPHSSTKF